MIHKMVTFRIKPNYLEEINRATREFIAEVKAKEPGVTFYEVYQLKDELDFIHLFSFQNEEIEQRHRTSAHVKRYLEILYPRSETLPKFTELVLTSSNIR